MRTARSSLFCGIAIVALSATTLTGCVGLAIGAAGGAAGAVYAKGRLVDQLDANVERSYNAALAALRDRDLVIKEDRADVSSAFIRSEYLDGEEIRISLDAITSNVTEIKIRVGLTGNSSRSIMLLEEIKARL